MIYFGAAGYRCSSTDEPFGLAARRGTRFLYRQLRAHLEGAGLVRVVTVSGAVATKFSKALQLTNLENWASYPKAPGNQSSVAGP